VRTSFVAELRARWRSFAYEADAVRDASAAIAALIRSRTAGEARPVASLPKIALPLEGRITSRFGMRHGRLHEGIDIARPAGTPVHPVLAGVVVLADELPGYGRVVVVEHTSSLATVYAHLASVAVAPLERVERTRPLGTVGETGRSFGPHLHFEVRFDGTAVDPFALVP